MCWSALVAAVAGTGSLRRGPLGIRGLLATTVAASAGRTTVAHLGTITRRGLGTRTSIVTLLLTVLGGYKVLAQAKHIRGWFLSLTTILRKVCARGAREARSLSALRAVVGLVGIEGLSGGSLVFAPLLNDQSQIHDKNRCNCARQAIITCSRGALLEYSTW